MLKVKKSVIDERNNTLITDNELTEIQDVSLLEELLTKDFNEYSKPKKDGLIMAIFRPKNVKPIKMKQYITDNGKVKQFNYNWTDVKSTDSILKNVTVSFVWKPSLEKKDLEDILLKE